MLAQVLNPSSWQATGLLAAAAASPFASNFVQQQNIAKSQMEAAHQRYDQSRTSGAAQLPLSDKLRCISAALTARFPQGTLAFAQVWQVSATLGSVSSHSAAMSVRCTRFGVNKRSGTLLYSIVQRQGVVSRPKRRFKCLILAPFNWNSL